MQRYAVKMKLTRDQAQGLIDKWSHHGNLQARLSKLARELRDPAGVELTFCGTHSEIAMLSGISYASYYAVDEAIYEDGKYVGRIKKPSVYGYISII